MKVGLMECAGYTWATTGATDAEIRATMRAEWRRRVADGAVVDVTAGDDPLEYHGLAIHDLTAGKVEWC